MERESVISEAVISNPECAVAHGQALRLQEFFKIGALDFCVLEDLVEQPRPKRLPGVNRDDGGTSVGMAKKMMAALGAEVGEPGSLERPENLSPCDSSQTAHTSTATRCTPTNSGPAMLVPSTSRHSSMASLMRLRSLSSERACVWQPCNSGTLAT